MKWYITTCIVVAISFMVWFRRLAGRLIGTPPSQDLNIQNIGTVTDFDKANPIVSVDTRTIFHDAVRAHITGNSDTALIKYNLILSKIPGEPTATHNIELITITKKK